LHEVTATRRVTRKTWPRPGRPQADADGPSGVLFLEALARELELEPIDLIDAGRIRAEQPTPAAPFDDSADRNAFHSQLMPPGFSVRSFAEGYAPGKLFSLVG
jgi:hypothetical protein